MGAARSILRWRRAAPPVTRRTSRPTQATSPEPVVESEPPNEELLQRLRTVYVESTDNTAIAGSQSQTLPQDRSYMDEDPLDMTVTVKEGRLTVYQLREMFDRARADPNKWNTATVAAEYKISETDAENLLKYFGNFNVVAKRDDPKLDLHHPTR